MIIEKLKHDLLLCKKNFMRFVECFNDLVERVSTLKGDADVCPSLGYINVDYTDDLHPVIRFNKEKIQTGGLVLKGCFEIDKDKDEFKNRYYVAGGVLDELNTTYKPSLCKGKIIGLVFEGFSILSTVYIMDFTDVAELNTYIIDNPYCTVTPLYKFDSSGEVEVDFRMMPIIDTWSRM